MRRKISFILFILSALVIAKAQGTIVSGKITDGNGAPMDMVHIRLSKGSIGTLSNFKGEYDLRVPQSDTLRIIFTSLGYKRVERIVNTNTKESVKLNIQMFPNTAVINDVEVTAKQRTNNSLEKIETTTIERVPSVSGNAVEDIIGTMAGVTINNEMSSHISVFCFI